MKNICRVIAVNGEMCTLATERKEACVGCQANCLGCGKTVTITIPNALGAKIGDEVEISTLNSVFLSLCALLFLLPLVLGFCAFLLGNTLWGESGGTIGAIAVFCLSFLIGIVISRRKKDSLSIKMERILSDTEKK